MKTLTRNELLIIGVLTITLGILLAGLIRNARPISDLQYQYVERTLRDRPADPALLQWTKQAIQDGEITRGEFDDMPEGTPNNGEPHNYVKRIRELADGKAARPVIHVTAEGLGTSHPLDSGPAHSATSRRTTVNTGTAQ